MNAKLEKLITLRTTGIDQISEIRIGNIDLPTGMIIACDPLNLYELNPMTTKAKAGNYPVYLHILKEKETNVVAFSEIRFSENAPIRFEIATTTNDLPLNEEDGLFIGYDVDDGVGCFMDEKLAIKIKSSDMDEISNRLRDLLAENEVNGYCVANFVELDSQSNLIAFSTGNGNGLYTSYFGYEEDDNLCCLITDFKVVQEEFTAYNQMEKASRMAWGKVIDDGYWHYHKIETKGLPLDKINGYNHLAVWLRWCTEHQLLSDMLLDVFPTLPEIVKNKELDLREMIDFIPVFNGCLKENHFNEIGKAFIKEFYIFNGKQKHYPRCVDIHAENVLGTEKYNCEEYQDEAYLFVPYDENYYHGLSLFIDEAWDKFNHQH